MFIYVIAFMSSSHELHGVDRTKHVRIKHICFIEYWNLESIPGFHILLEGH